MAVDDGGGLPWRVAQLERDRDEDREELAKHGRDLVRHDEQISGAGGLIRAMQTLSDKVDSLNKALYTFAAAFIAAAVTIALSVSH